MGNMESESNTRDDIIQYAVELCIKFKALKRCRFHEEEYFDQHAFPDHDELAARILAENPGSWKIFGSYENMERYVSEAMDSAGEKCGRCARNSD